MSMPGRLRLLSNRIVDPSGDQAGSVSSAVFVVRRTGAVAPAASTTQMSESPAVPGTPRRVNAIRAPSCDQAGSISIVVLVVRRTGSVVPAASTT